ncbi:hypothetical protein ONS95_000694 [Cadophora gregata]|uniref:uncharacterized protein n=1 Tax=Cadophora gregata TaxID=51156 RepID=UPI0026DB69E6|nr:uncharacterized protein ONS95_000694 [Cadophora gregata]KAK0103130.1 hypothetical protein ONS96_005738 [Cadophora gregata f. sp. sojae]KAK0128739.1 hypothetical protein ONS95_000694 [Cadophora gregata]
MAVTTLSAIRSSLKVAYHRLTRKSSTSLSIQSRRLSILQSKTELEVEVQPNVVIKAKHKFKHEIEIVALDPVKIAASLEAPATFSVETPATLSLEALIPISLEAPATIPLDVPITAVTVTGKANFNRRSLKIIDLPNDVLLMIFDLLVKHSYCKTSATCFGLSHPTFYPILKSYVPSPIGLKDNYEIIRGLPGSETIFSLSSAIVNFMGLEYRVGNYTRKFLARSVYGDVIGQLEIELDRRYHAYTDTVEIVSKETVKGLTHYALRRLVLPNPYGMGSEWYPEAIKVKTIADQGGIRLGSFVELIVNKRGVSWTFV